MYEQDKFLFPEIIFEGIRMAEIKEIAVMKLDAIQYGGRKKDFWDLHYFLSDMRLDLTELIRLHEKRFEYTHDRKQLIDQLKSLSRVDDEPDPICNLNKNWPEIKLDILDFVSVLKH